MDNNNFISSHLKVTVIGLGLIGGSIARALRERAGIRDITAVDSSPGAVKAAVEDGNITRGFSQPNEFVWNSDIIFICTPVNGILGYIDALAGKVKPGCVITDAGSTKALVMEHVNSMPAPPPFVGGHPMAGTEKAGYAASFAHLFENAYYILTPSRTADQSSINLLSRLVEAMGAIPIVLDAEEHDRVTGCISHVPHIIAASLVNLVRMLDGSSGKMQMLAAGGFKDITRIASSNPEIWEHIVLSNKDQVKDILHSYLEIVSQFEDFIGRGDSRGIYDFFQSARDYRNTFSERRKGLIIPASDIVLDVVDRPGIIGEIATILGDHGINIKNMNISNSREFEQGCLRITLSDPDSAQSAFELLKSLGYKAYKY